MNATMIELRNIEKYFGGVHALKGVSLQIPRGQVTSIIGDNGAGKSTLIKCISGMHTPTSGEIFIDGKSVKISSPRESRHLGIETVYAALNIYRGLAFLYTEGKPIFGIPDGFRDVFAASIGPVPKPIILLVVVTIICFLILNRSRSGTHLKAVGTNADAARKSGVSVNRIKVLAFALSGLLCGLGALMLMARIGAAEPISGTGYELTVIAAVVVGGTSLMGGRASIIGTVLGAILLGAIRTGLTLMNVNPFLQLVVTGAIILLAVLLDRAISNTKVKR